MEKGEDGLLRTRDGSLPPASAGVTLEAGVLETSNVSMVEAMTNMIELARQFEMQVQMMKNAEQNDEASARLMQLT